MSPADVVELRSGQAATDFRQILSLSLWLLSARSYQWATLILVGSAFGVTLAQPSPLRIVTCVLFAVLVHVPTWWSRKEKAS